MRRLTPSATCERTAALDAAVATCSRQLATVAEWWLRAGASSFGIWCDNRPIACWPGDVPDLPGMIVPVRAGSAYVAELRVAGIEDPSARLRLAADADLFGRQIALEADLGAMTSEVVDIQDQLLALYALSQSLRNQLTVETTLGALADAAARLIQVPGAFAGLAAANGTVRAIVTGPAGFGDATSAAELAQIFTQALGEGREIVVNGQGDDTPLMPPGSGKNLLFLPIQVRGAAVAGLGLVDRPGGFTAPNRKLARSLAEQAGAQLENVLYYEEMLTQATLRAEFDLAAGIQGRLLPRHAPQPDGIAIVGRTLPARQIGGDFYDFVARADTPCTFVVGDVSGKGMPAALLMAISQRVIHNAVRAAPWSSPAALMARASGDLYDAFTEVGMFATIFVGQYDPGAERLSFANAGHSPVIYRPAGGPARLLEADGTALGIFAESFCEDHSLPFGPGDLLLVATDGFSEACAPGGGMFGYERLLRLADAVADRPTAEIADAFFATVARFAAGLAQEDDQTLVVIKGVER